MSFSTNFTASLLDIFNNNEETANGLQDIVLGNRHLSLILVFFVLNIVLLTNYYFSKSAIGMIILSALLFVFFPISYSYLKENIKLFVDHPVLDEYKLVHNRRTNKEFAAAIGAFYDNHLIKFIHKYVFDAGLLKSHQIPQIILLNMVLTLLFSFIGFLPIALTINFIFFLFIFIMRYLLL